MDENRNERPFPKEGSFTNSDGLKLFSRYWYPEDNKIRALVILIHGIGEHSGRYDDVASAFTKLGCMVFMHDHIGHGQSEGARVDIDDFDKFTRDCLHHVDIVTEKHPDLPVMVFGHSLGGLIAVLLMNCAHPRFIGAIIASPALKIDPAMVSPFVVFVGKILARICPHAPIAKLDVTKLSRVPAVVEDYQKDPLNWHGGVKARMALQVVTSLQKIHSEYDKATYPFLLIHGTKDTICPIDGSEEFFAGAVSQNKEFKRYEGYFHELVREPEGEREIVFKDIEDWTLKLLSTNDGESAASPSDVSLNS